MGCIPQVACTADVRPKERGEKNKTPEIKITIIWQRCDQLGLTIIKEKVMEKNVFKKKKKNGKKPYRYGIRCVGVRAILLNARQTKIISIKRKSFLFYFFRLFCAYESGSYNTSTGISIIRFCPYNGRLLAKSNEQQPRPRGTCLKININKTKK